MHSQVTRFVVLVAIAAVAVSVVAWAQSPRGASKATIGGSEVSVDYGRPSLRGRDMLGQAPRGYRLAHRGGSIHHVHDRGRHHRFRHCDREGRVQLVHETSERRHVAPSVQLPDRAVGHVPTDASRDVGEAQLTWKKDGDATEQLTIELSGSGNSGEIKLMWGD